MVVANTLAAGHSAVPLSQLRATSSLPLEAVNCSYKNKIPHDLPIKFVVRRSKNYKVSCCLGVGLGDGEGDGNSANLYSSASVCSSSRDWDWNRWTRHFFDIEQAENYASVLKFQLEEAIEKEDFQEAARLKVSISEIMSKDSIAEIMSELKIAITEERYHDASRLCRDTGSGLVGWWVGYSRDKDDPFGRLVHITPGVGRLVAKCYSPRQLVTSSPGTPLFEIFVVKDPNGTFKMQVVFLKENKRSSKKLNSSDAKTTKEPSEGDNRSTTIVDVKLEDGAKKSERKTVDLEEAAEEGIKSVINFLKERIPELKVKVMRVDVTEDTVKQFIDEDREGNTTESSDGEVTDLDNDHQEQVVADGDTETLGNELYIGGVTHNKDEDLVEEELTRVPANIAEVEKDSFVLHIPMTSEDNENEDNILAKDAAEAAQSVFELMPPEVAKAFWNSGKVSKKVSKDVRDFVKLAMSKARKKSRLSEYTSFNRITTSSGDLDPFEGLYVGAFGPYGTEIVQLRRKYGNWKTRDGERSSEMEFFEYVEAVKLTGDFNVPAGQVTFRAKIGKGNRLANLGAFPHELGVVASYKGQGRIADFGFENPQWVEGELLQLNGKGLGPYIKGAELGFLYVAPGQNVLVLFNRLRLPE